MSNHTDLASAGTARERSRQSVMGPNGHLQASSIPTEFLDHENPPSSAVVPHGQRLEQEVTLHPTSLDCEVPQGLTAEGARDLTDQIRVGLEGVFQLIKAAYRGRAWFALGYSTWDDYVTREFGNLHLRPPREQRHDVVLSLREAGMSVRSIASATQLGRGSVERELQQPDVPNGTTTEPNSIQGQDGKFYRATRTAKSVDRPDDVAKQAEVAVQQFSAQTSGAGVLDVPASVAGVEPLDLAVRAEAGRKRVSRLLREFHGSGSAALPMTIKLASQVAGLVSPVTGTSEVLGERLHELAYDVTRGLCSLSHVASSLRESMPAGGSTATIKANLRDARDEMDRLLRHMETSS